MADDKYEDLGPALAAIGSEIMQILDGQADQVYLYVEAGGGWVAPSLFRNEGKAVRYFDVPDTSELDQLIMAAWCLEEPDKRWSAMHYVINGGKFNATFDFADETKPNEDIHDRRQRILHDRYGDKPIIYPPMPVGMEELRPK